MRFLTIHLSDLHIQSEDDPVLGRASRIVSALQCLGRELDLCVVLITGDVASSGTEDQYLVALEFLGDLKRQLEAQLTPSRASDRVQVEYVVVPGNHDCSFTTDGTARDAVISGILSGGASPKEDAVVEACAEPQRHFFQFLQALETTPNTCGAAGYDRRLYYEYAFSLRNEVVRFLCCNTAWLSQRHETQGQLPYPSDAIPDPRAEDSYVIAAFHHPYNWMPSESGRRFRIRLETCADVVLTAHEHEVSRTLQQHGTGEWNAHIEGGALQRTDGSDDSRFNAYVLDTDRHQQRYGFFRWADERYCLSKETQFDPAGFEPIWEPLLVNSARRRDQFQLSTEHEAFLLDPGLGLQKTAGRAVTLPEIYVFPDLAEVLTELNRANQVIPGAEVLDFVDREAYLLVSGDHQVGKTALGKMLYRNFLDRGLVPIWIDGNERPPAGESLYSYIETRFHHQYEPADIDRYRELSSSKRVIILDNYETIRWPIARKHALLRRLRVHAGKVIVLSNDLAADLEQFVEPEVGGNRDGNCRHFRIRAFGHESRHHLIEKWLVLGREETTDPGILARALGKMTAQLNIVIGRNYVPAYPVYMLIVLQTFDAVAGDSTPIDTRASTHGYFYEILIKIAVARGKDRVEYDLLAAYLAFVAHYMFREERSELSDEELRQCHARFEEDRDLDWTFEEATAQLEQQQILVRTNDMYSFKYPYIRYYFIAIYMRDRIGQEETKIEVSRAAHSLVDGDNADILMFLAHLSRDPFVINAFLDAAEQYYPELNLATFETGTLQLAGFSGLEFEEAYEETDPVEYRRRIAEGLDRAETALSEQKESEPETEEAKDVLERITRLGAALRCLEILGQLLKNFPGSLDGQTKLRIGRASYAVGLRTATAMFQLLSEHHEPMLEWLLFQIREHNPDLTRNEVIRAARESFGQLVLLAAFGTVKRISGAVGAPRLANTYARLLEEMPWPSTMLIDMSLRLDQSGTFPEGRIKELSVDSGNDVVVTTVLRQLVITHFNLYEVDYRTKQRTCEVLGIAYGPHRRQLAQRRLLPAPRREAG